MKNLNLIKRLWTDSHEKQSPQRFGRYVVMLIMLLTLAVGQMWANGGIGYKGVKFTKNSTATGWYNIHDVGNWDYHPSSYDCRSGQSGVTDFNNANLGIVATLKLKAFVVIGWCSDGDYVAGQLKYRLYKQSASAPSYSTYNVGNYNSPSSGAVNVLANSGNDRVVGSTSLTTNIVTASTAPGNYYLQLQGLGRAQWANNGSGGSFNDNNGSEVKATLTVPGFTTTSTSHAFGSVNVGSNSSTTISFTQHYGTTLTTSNCALTGTNSSEFEVTGISETGVTVKFKPSSAGSKSATLTITDAHSKTCTITLTGTGVAAATRTLTYHANYIAGTGSGTGSVPAAQTVAVNANATVAGKNTLAFVNYTFSGWDTEEHITGTHYDKDDEITMDTDKDLYAVWTRTIPLDDQGATTAVTGDVYGTYNSSYLPSFTNPKKTGYKFNGWTTELGGGGSFVIDTLGNLQAGKHHWTQESPKTNLFVRPSTSISTLKAWWTQTVTLNANTANHGVSPNRSATATWNKNSVSLSTHCTPATGYRLDGYYTAATGGTKIINSDKSLVGGNVIVSGDTYLSSGKWMHNGATTLYAQYTLIPCSLMYGANTPLNSPTSVAMSYDDGLNAYYKDVTTNSSPYYFRFEYDGNKQYSGDWNSYPGVNEVTVGGSKVACATEVQGWDNKASLKYIGSSGTTIRIWFDKVNKKAWITETQYAVTVNDGAHGTVSPHGTVQAGATVGTSLEAEAATGYHFTGWTKGGTVANIALSSTTTNPTTLTATGTGGTVTANYEANTYRVQFHRNGGEGDVVYQDFTYDVAQNLTANTYTRTGYNFAGWALSSGGSVTYADGAEVSNLIATNNATFHLYAKWTAKQSSITLDQTGYGTAGSTTTRTGTYGLAMPAITGANTLPVAPTGYKFMGYYDNLSPLGTKYYNADGTSAHSWDKDTEDPTTLYAYYQKAEITSIAVSPNVVAQGVTITATPTISPIPEGTTMICWRVLYSNTNPLDVQPTFRQGPDNSVLFAAPETSASYKIEAKLYTGSTCGEGTSLSTTTADFQVAGLHKVTVRYKCGDEVISDPTTLEGIRPLDWSEEIPAPSIFGYIFNGWTAGDGVSLTDDDGSTTKTSTDKDHPSIKIKANYDGYLTASYTKVDYIYFKNTMGWSNVYVYFYTSDLYWDDVEHGSGSNKYKEFKQGDGTTKPYWDEKHGQLTRLGETDIWYFDAGAISCKDWVNIVFNANDQPNYDWFSATEVVRRGDFMRKTPMYVPADKTKYSPTLKNTSAYYYNKGYWVNYLGENTGYTLEVYNEAGSSLLRSVKFTSDDHMMPMVATLDLEAGTSYKFRLKRDGNTDGDVYYGNTGSMTYADRYLQGTPWAFTSGTGKCGLTTTAAGDYVFHLTYSQNGSGEYDLRIAVEHPIKSGDYRLVYSDNKPTCKPSAIVPKVNNGKDTVSFFIRPSNSPALKIQTASVNASTGAITWGSDVNVTSSLSSLTKDSVYNICLTMNGSGAISVESVEAYTGNYYIRTDVANSKWDNWTSDPDHLMTYSEYSIEHGGYSHYYCHWVKTGDKPNVKFCIANDYSPCISDTLTRETNTGTWANINSHIDASGNVTTDANVRFMWNQADNTISRAYVDGAQGTGSNNFLYILSEDGKITKSNGSALDDNKVNFSDNENWIYEANLKVQPNAEIKLLSNWGSLNTITQYFKGSSSKTDKLIGGSGTDWYDIRVVYDFKTNRLISTWIPSEGEITTDRQIEADVMFIREHHGDIAQLTFGESGKISEIKTAYGVLRLNKWTLANKSKEGGHSALLDPKSIYERSLYWISFPFRVKLSEVLAFGAYGTHWAVQRYDGADRAARGHFLENGSFWKWMDRNTEYLEPNQGYLLAVDLDLLGEGSDVWGPDSRSSQLEIYFPSYGTMPDITNADVEQTITPHVCEINRAATEGLPDTGNPRTSYNRTIFDSHWNVMSVPTYVNTEDVTFANSTWTSTIGPNFLYTWNSDDNTITATLASDYTYHAMHAYMVQYGGTVTWRASSGSPASIVARRTYAEKPSKVEFRLELQQNEKMIDRTYVVLSSDEDVSSEFRFGEDMTKEFNANKANIYTKIDYLGVAGNTLPMSEQTTVVPVGVEIKTNGDYTFTMPDGTEGIGVTLIDNESGVRTNLGLTDYVVTLSKGDYVDRFALEISPIKQMPTDIENADASVHDAVRKVVVDGILYIVKEGVVYDARGNRVK